MRCGGSRDGETAGHLLQVQGGAPPRGEGPSPSTGVRGTTVVPVVRALGLCSTVSFSYMHLHETPASKGIGKQWGG